MIYGSSFDRRLVYNKFSPLLNNDNEQFSTWEKRKQEKVKRLLERPSDDANNKIKRNTGWVLLWIAREEHLEAKPDSAT